METSADPDQMAFSEASCTGSPLFSKDKMSGLSRTQVKEDIAPKYSGLIHPVMPVSVVVPRILKTSVI